MERITFLELDRREGESIIIGDNITITVTRIRKIKKIVHLGIDAPKNLRINRLEPLDNRSDLPIKF